MFSSRFNRVSGLSNILGKNNRYHRPERCLCRCISFIGITDPPRWILYSQPNNVKDNNAFYGLNNGSTNSVLIAFGRDFSTPSLFTDPNKFGNLSNAESEKVEMDEDEKAEEEFRINEVSVPKWQKLSQGQYAARIKSYVEKGDLQAALGVLDLIKQNRDKPTVYLYNLLIYGFATQGILKTCFKLYNDMKKRGLEPNTATYTSLINVCARSQNKNEAMNKLHDLRQIFIEQSIPLNDTHYNAMINAYALHGEIHKAFELADEMTDKKLKFTDVTYTCLLHAAISDKKSGVKHALSIWHLMKKFCVKPTRTHYKQLIRTIRDTNLGNLKVNDILIPGTEWTQIQLCKDKMPDLLASPPVLNPLLTTLIAQPKAKQTKMVASASNTSEVTLHSSENSALSTDADIAELISKNLDKIFVANRLVLFGGVDNILRRIEEDCTVPDIVLLTLILDVLPPVTQAEDYLLDYASKKNISLDTLFCNRLIRKRSLRGNYVGAQHAFNLLQQYQLVPDVHTYSALAMGCMKRREILEFIKGLESVGYVPNVVVMGVLLRNATQTRHFSLIKELLQYMKQIRIRPSDKIYEIIDTMKSQIEIELKKKDRNQRKQRHQLARDYKAFLEYYEAWKIQVTERNKRR